MNPPSPAGTGIIEGATLRTDQQARPTNPHAPFEHTAVESSVPACFERIVATHANRPAVREASRTWTYRELDDEANRIAHALLAQRPFADGPVAVLLDNHARALATGLAVLKAGHCFTGISTTDMAPRLRARVEAAQSRVIVTDGRNLALAEDIRGEDIAIVNIDDLPQGLPATRPDIDVSPNDTSHIVYTSGSTGEPKGVIHTHRNTLYNTMSYVNNLHLAPDDRLTLFGSLAGSASVMVGFGGLLTGACLFPFNLKEHGVTRLATWLAEEKITILNTVSSAFRYFARNVSENAAFPDLRIVRLGGEQLQPIDIELFRKAFEPPCCLVNVLGMTEVGPLCSYFFDHDTTLPTPLPVGYTDDGRRLMTVDESGAVLPVGEVGELVVVSRYLSSGYHRRPDLESEKFRDDPDDPGVRHYRTGDFARLHPDGCCEILGRTDFQLNIRGQTARVAEIENALLRHESVAEAAVVGKDDADSNCRVVAYIVPASGHQPTELELQDHVYGELPDFMVPSVIVNVESLPRNENGKLDRLALPDVDLETALSKTGDDAPRTKLEEALAEVWSDVLNVQHIGMHDSFLALGGESLKGAHLVDTLREHLGEYVHLVILHDAPTIAEQAAKLHALYPEGVARWLGLELEGRPASTPSRVDENDVRKMRHWIQTAGPFDALNVPAGIPAKKNPPAVFILSPPRSGSTLLRVMLAGHSKLFCPPLLHLLPFERMSDWYASFSDAHAFRREGVVRALMEIEGCDGETAERQLQQLVRDDLLTQDFYRFMQERLPGRTLVDKSSNYSVVPACLQRIENQFEDVRYVHLCRHPMGMIHSYDKIRLDQVYFNEPPPFPRRTSAELIWLLSHRHILDLLERVPGERQHRVLFEELVHSPQREMEKIAAFLDIDAEETMWMPYDGRRSRMTDGVRAGHASTMLGDPKFIEHKHIDPSVADRWRDACDESALGEPSRELSKELGYPDEDSYASVVPLRSHGSKPALYCVPGAGSDAYALSALTLHLSEEQPIYALQARGIDPDREPYESIEDMASEFVRCMRQFHRSGPYLIAGTSFGGTVAYEIAQQLVAGGDEVAFLGLMETHGPGFPEKRPNPKLRRRALHMLRWCLPIGNKSELSWRNFRKGVKERFDRFRGLMAIKFPAYRKRMPSLLRFTYLVELHFRAAHRYAPKAYPGTLTLFRTETQPPEELFKPDPCMGWKDCAIGGLDIQEVPGHHGAHIKEPYVRGLAEKLQRCLDEAALAGSGSSCSEHRTSNIQHRTSK